jgi:hypothetical protein
MAWKVLETLAVSPVHLLHVSWMVFCLIVVVVVVVIVVVVVWSKSVKYMVVLKGRMALTNLRNRPYNLLCMMYFAIETLSREHGICLTLDSLKPPGAYFSKVSRSILSLSSLRPLCNT